MAYKWSPSSKFTHFWFISRWTHRLDFTLTLCSLQKPAVQLSEWTQKAFKRQHKPYQTPKSTWEGCGTSVAVGWHGPQFITMNWAQFTMKCGPWASPYPSLLSSTYGKCGLSKIPLLVQSLLMTTSQARWDRMHSSMYNGSWQSSWYSVSIIKSFFQKIMQLNTWRCNA